MLEVITGHEIVDRLPMLVNESTSCWETMASAIFETILSWSLNDKIRCMFFDTTVSKTGRINGACILLEHKMQMELIWFAYLRIVLEVVAILCVGSSSSLEIMI